MPIMAPMDFHLMKPAGRDVGLRFRRGRARSGALAALVLFLALGPGAAPDTAAFPAVPDGSFAGRGAAGIPGSSAPRSPAVQERRIVRDPGENGPGPRPRIVLGYYPFWNRAGFGASKIDFSRLTHLAHAFTRPNSQGDLIVPAGYLDPELVPAAHARGVKVLMSVGGWGNCAGFPGMTATYENRRRFVDQVLGFLRANAYDGVDLDWEFAANAVERVRFTLLVEELAAALKAERPPRLLTMAAPSTNYWARWIAFEDIVDDLDLVGIMSYGYHGEWSEHSGHNAPLRSGGDPCGSLEESLRYGLARSVPARKLLLGLPFFGRFFDSPGLYQKFTKSRSAAYADIRGLRNAGWTSLWDDAAGVPWLLRPDAAEIVSFDDERSIADKCALARASGAAGVMIWELTQDTVGGRPVLLEAVARELSKADEPPGPPSGPGVSRERPSSRPGTAL